MCHITRAESCFCLQTIQVEWYLGDTTQSLAYLAAGSVDVAFTYNEAAEVAEVKTGKAVSRELVFIVSSAHLTCDFMCYPAASFRLVDLCSLFFYFAVGPLLSCGSDFEPGRT